MDFEILIPTIRKLAIMAGEKIMEVYSANDFEIKVKSDESPVTEADETADAIISEGLRAAFPNVALVTEEQADSHIECGDTFLIVDPLDGTKEFINRRGDFTVNIAYVEDGIPKRGIVFAPARNRMFYTDVDGRSVEEIGIFDPNVIGVKKTISIAKADNSALLVVASKSHLTDETKKYIEKYRVSDFKSAGSSLKFCLVASGEADLYPRVGRTMEWDTAAGHAVLLGAGGTVVRYDDHTPLIYGKKDFANSFFVAHAPSVELKEP
ncbi:3'(2'),5'-bisphosphate nucleotidase CysQ [Pseudopelagicola sp. nBUS_20]|uniref:3'(2'),5'-bisphosphate nucleotidase CysQ n=1 Tax=Pseudopelagicola sp. nBUS_20 TaxID=3395317 RepID=UPI003EBC0016